MPTTAAQIAVEKPSFDQPSALAGSRWRWPALLCLLFVAVRLPFIFIVPMAEAPDEFAHLWVARFLFDNHALPSAAAVAAGGPSTVYGSLPQLGYLPHIAVASLAPGLDFALAARFGSLLMGLVLLMSAWALGREAFGRERILAAALPLTVVFHPQVAFVHSYLNNDATASAVASVILVLAVRALRQGVSLGTSAAVGILTGWLALTKYSGLGILPSVALCMVASVVIKRTSIARVLANFAVCAAIAAGECGWWFARNMSEFAGDMLGTKTMYHSWATTFHRPETYYLPASHIIKSVAWWRMMFFSFWGMFGYMNKYMWRFVYLIYLGFLCLSAAGGILVVGRWCASKLGLTQSSYPAGGDAAETRLSAVRQGVIWASLVLAVVLNLSAMIWASTTNLGGPQGRYLFTSELPVVALLIGGLNALSRRHGTKLVASFVALNAVTLAGVWIWLFRLYGWHWTPLS